MIGKCDVCGGSIAHWNKSGVCSRTIECRREHDARRRAKHPEVHDSAYRLWWRRYHAKHREARNAACRRWRLTKENNER